jgi:hypothetical protein
VTLHQRAAGALTHSMAHDYRHRQEYPAAAISTEIIRMAFRVSLSPCSLKRNLPSGIAPLQVSGGSHGSAMTSKASVLPGIFLLKTEQHPHGRSEGSRRLQSRDFQQGAIRPRRCSERQERRNYKPQPILRRCQSGDLSAILLCGRNTPTTTLDRAGAGNLGRGDAGAYGSDRGPLSKWPPYPVAKNSNSK